MRVKNILTEDVLIKRICDFYVPIKLEFVSNKKYNEKLVYYRLIKQDSSFVEFSIGASSGKVVEITLVSLNSIDTTNKSYKAVEIKGNPIIDVEELGDKNVITHKVEFKIIKLDKKMIIFWDENIVQKIMFSETKIYLNNQSEIVGYEVSGFSENEWREIEECIMANVY